MNKFVKFLTILFLGLIPYAMQGYICSYAKLRLETDQGNKEIILLGDCHVRTKTDRDHYYVLKDAVDRWAQDTQKTLLMTEFREDAHKNAYLMAAGVTFGDLFGMHFIHAINKLPEYLDFAKIKYKNSDLVIDNIADDRSSVFISNSRAFNSSFRPKTECIIKRLQCYVKDMDTCVKEDLAKTPSLDQLEQAIKPLQERALEALIFFQNLMAIQGPMPQWVQEKLDDYYDQIFIQDMADVGFFMRILLNYKQFDRLVLYVGAMHTKNVYTALKQCFGNQLHVVDRKDYAALDDTGVLLSLPTYAIKDLLLPKVLTKDQQQLIDQAGQVMGMLAIQDKHKDLIQKLKEQMQEIAELGTSHCTESGSVQRRCRLLKQLIEQSKKQLA